MHQMSVNFKLRMRIPKISDKSLYYQVIAEQFTDIELISKKMFIVLKCVYCKYIENGIM